jgi:tetratricopeptide (TPR) repeat protein
MLNSFAVTVALALLAQDRPPSPAGFRALDFDAALAAAKADSRPLLVDFYDPASNEWKVMQALTWNDPVMLRWLDARFVAVQFDITAQPELAKRLQVERAPTSVLLTHTGLEVDRIVGFLEAKPFMAEGQGILHCVDKVGAERTALDADPTNPAAHVELGRAFMACGRYPRALECLLWAFDHGARRPDFREARLAMLPMHFRQLIARYPGARQQLLERRDRSQAELLAFKEGADSVALALDITALNTALTAERKHLQLFEQLLARPDTPRSVLEALYSKLLVDLLVRERRWPELLAGRGDVLVWLDREYVELAALARELATTDERTPERSEEGLSVRRNGVLFAGANCVEALLCTGKPQEARQALDIILLHDARAHAHSALLRACLGGKDLELARQVVARAERAGLSATEIEALRKALDAAAPGGKR